MKKALLLMLAVLICGSVFAQDGIIFTFSCNNNPLKLNEMIYKSSRGLTYQVSQVKYFVTDIRIINKDKSVKDFPESCHYVDVEIARTLQWTPAEDFNLQNADSIEFTFGFSAAQNRSYRFKNPPENLMFWPDYLGGGYHYMKTNILYLDAEGNTNAFNCHIGRGQVYDAEGEPIEYIDNDFRVKIPVKRQDNNAVINLDISTMFDYPNAELFTDYRGIMNNQKAMKTFSENIKAAFER
jgi:hypothetical protein